MDNYKKSEIFEQVQAAIRPDFNSGRSVKMSDSAYKGWLEGYLLSLIEYIDSYAKMGLYEVVIEDSTLQKNKVARLFLESRGFKCQELTVLNFGEDKASSKPVYKLTVSW